MNYKKVTLLKKALFVLIILTLKTYTMELDELFTQYHIVLQELIKLNPEEKDEFKTLSFHIIQILNEIILCKKKDTSQSELDTLKLLHKRVLQRALYLGIDPDTKYNESTTLLMLVAQSGCVDSAQLLLNYGARINEQSDHGYTALMHAVRYEDHYEMVQLLAFNGASLNILTKNRETVFDLANTWDGRRIKQFLKKYATYVKLDDLFAWRQDACMHYTYYTDQLPKELLTEMNKYLTWANIYDVNKKQPESTVVKLFGKILKAL